MLFFEGGRKLTACLPARCTGKAVARTCHSRPLAAADFDIRSNNFVRYVARFLETTGARRPATLL